MLNGRLGFWFGALKEKVCFLIGFIGNGGVVGLIWAAVVAGRGKCGGTESKEKARGGGWDY